MIHIPRWLFYLILDSPKFFKRLIIKGIPRTICAVLTFHSPWHHDIKNVAKAKCTWCGYSWDAFPEDWLKDYNNQPIHEVHSN